MNTRKLLFGYFKELFQKWYLVAIAIFDIIGLLAEPFINIQIPTWAYLAIFGAAFLYANFSLYCKGQQEILSIKNQHKREVTKLKERIAEIEDRQPDLELLFQTDQGLTQHQTISVSNPPEKPNYDELVHHEAKQIELATKETEEDKAPTDITEKDDLHKSMRLIQESIRALQQQSIRAMQQRRKSPEEYEEECNTHLKEYRQYLTNIYNYELYTARLRSTQFAIKNTGKAPAEDIIVRIHFPDTFYFPSEEELFNIEFHYKDRPQPPERPKLFEPLFKKPDYTLADSAIFDKIQPQAYTGSPNVTGPFINPKNSTEVSYKVRKLLHDGFPTDLDEVKFFVLEEAVEHTWELNYSIHAASLLKPIENYLTLEIQLAE